MVLEPFSVNNGRETWLASFLEMNPNPILAISLDGYIQYTNPAIRRIFPTLEEQRTHHPFLANWEEIRDQVRNQPDLDINREIKIGETYYQQSISFIEENRSLRVFGINITPRKRAEALDKALNRIHQIIHSYLSFEQIMQKALAEAAHALDCDNATISLRKGRKWIPTYVVGTPLSALGHVMNDDEERHAILAIKTKQPVAVEDAFNDERFNREHLRKWYIYSVLVVPILLKNKAIGVIFFNYQQAIYHFQEMHIDFGQQLAASLSLALENARLIEGLQKELEKRKKTEVALAKANDHLEQRVQKRTAKLEHLMTELSQTTEKLQMANGQLKSTQKELVSKNNELEAALEIEKSLRQQLIQTEKYAALSRLVASMAHEIYNPLQTIKNSLYLLEQDLQSTSSHQILEMALSESQRMGTLVQQLRETFQPADLQEKDFNLIEILEDVHQLLVPQFHQNNIQFEFHTSRNEIYLHGFPDQLKQVFLNICLNAMDAMEPQGGLIQIAVSDPRADHQVCISIQDNGRGIPAKDVDKIFEPFFTTKEQGTGLGLAISYEIVKNHAGEIFVESQPGEGTTFQLFLPVL